MKTIKLLIAATCLSLDAVGATLTWTNTAGGSWSDTANWSPNQIPAAGDTANLTTDGTYSISVTANVTVAALNLGATTGVQTLSVDSATFNCTTAGTVLNNGILTVNGGSGVSGSLLVGAGGEMNLGGSGVKFLYGLVLNNEGTVNQVEGTVYGNSGTVITNAGLWEVQGDLTLVWTSGGSVARYENTTDGIIRKSAGSGTANISGFKLNQQGSVEVQSGTLTFGGNSGVWTLGGMTTVSGGANFTINGGSATADGGVFTGAGSSRFDGGTLTLNEDVLSGLALTGGTVQLGPAFQGDGQIHLLTLSGSQLDGDHEVAAAGVLTVNSGSGVSGSLLVGAGGEMNLGGSGVKFLYGLVLNNEGTVNHVEGTVYGNSGTVITNAGLWEVQGDLTLVWTSGGSVARYENTTDGIIRKSAGDGTANISGFKLNNAGRIESAVGTLRLPTNYENRGGFLRLSGGRLDAQGTLLLSGGVLEGSGTFGASQINGGTISPGLGGPGKITFASGLNVSAGTIEIDAIGSTPATGHDQIAVTGGVNITNCSLSFTPTASLPIGTKLVVLDNDGAEPIAGTFSGFADGTLFDANMQLFRTWYFEGTGNDFAIIRANEGVRLTSGGLDPSGQFTLSGLGTNNATYKIFATPVLPATSWEEIGEAVANPGGKFEFVDPDAHLFDMRFYRTLGP